MDLSHLLFVGLVASAAVTAVEPKQDPATASLAAQIAPDAIVGAEARPESTRRTPAPCDPSELGRQVYDFCSPGTTNPECCDAVVAAVEGTVTPGGFPCLCELEGATAFILTGFGISHIAALYADECGGLRPGVDRLVDVCNGDGFPPTPSQKPRTPLLHHESTTSTAGATSRTRPNTLKF